MKLQSLPRAARRATIPSGAASGTEAVEPESYGFGPFRLWPDEHILRRGGEVLPLPPKAFETLLLLVRNPGHLMRKEDLLAALWPDSFVEEVSLASKISLLRKALDAGGAAGRYIQTVPKQGYRFVAAVTRTWATALSTAPIPAVEERERVIRLIALPFRMVNAGESATFLGHSLPEAISASLAGLRSLTIRSSTLAACLAESQQDPRRIAAEADVDMLLAGSIVCDGGQMQISAELVDAAGTLTGSFNYTSGRDDLIEVAERLVRGIVEALRLQLTEREQQVLAHNVPASARAYEFYLRANHVLRRRTFENASMARDLYRECLEEDPAYAPAWARLGRCYRFLEKFGQEGPQSLESAKWAFHQAFALSPDLPLTHNLYTPFEADCGRARDAMLRLLRQAEKSPNDPELFGGLVQACRYCGLLEESVRADRRARRLDSRIVTSVAHTWFLLGDDNAALAWYPPGSRYYLDLAILAARGRETEAIGLLQGRCDLGGLFPALLESLDYLLRGDCERSIESATRGLAVLPKPDPESRFYLARHLAKAGAYKEALGAIRCLTADGFWCSNALKNDPWLEPLHALAEFEETLDEAVRLESEARAAFQGAGGDVTLG